ncbi:MAG: YbhB/YbcL family Raf kinase inhibitor-like protein [bacterium]
MKLISTAFQHEGQIPSRYTCDGENISPPLSLRGIPAKAQSLALVMEDPDVPRNLRQDGMWDHWIVFNIPPTLTEIREGEEPPGVAGIGTGGEPGYSGPCPPDREHRYYIKVYALDAELRLAPGATKRQLEEAMKGHVVSEAVLMGRYARRRG